MDSQQLQFDPMAMSLPATTSAVVVNTNSVAELANPHLIAFNTQPMILSTDSVQTITPNDSLASNSATMEAVLSNLAHQERMAYSSNPSNSSANVNSDNNLPIGSQPFTSSIISDATQTHLLDSGLLNTLPQQSSPFMTTSQEIQDRNLHNIIEINRQQQLIELRQIQNDVALNSPTGAIPPNDTPVVPSMNPQMQEMLAQAQHKQEEILASQIQILLDNGSAQHPVTSAPGAPMSSQSGIGPSPMMILDATNMDVAQHAVESAVAVHENHVVAAAALNQAMMQQSAIQDTNGTTFTHSDQVAVSIVQAAAVTAASMMNQSIASDAAASMNMVDQLAAATQTHQQIEKLMSQQQQQQQQANTVNAVNAVNDLLSTATGNAIINQAMIGANLLDPQNAAAAAVAIAAAAVSVHTQNIINEVAEQAAVNQMLTNQVAAGETALASPIAINGPVLGVNGERRASVSHSPPHQVSLHDSLQSDYHYMRRPSISSGPGSPWNPNYEQLPATMAEQTPQQAIQQRMAQSAADSMYGMTTESLPQNPALLPGDMRTPSPKQQQIRFVTEHPQLARAHAQTTGDSPTSDNDNGGNNSSLQKRVVQRRHTLSGPYSPEFSRTAQQKAELAKQKEAHGAQRTPTEERRSSPLGQPPSEPMDPSPITMRKLSMREQRRQSLGHLSLPPPPTAKELGLGLEAQLHRASTPTSSAAALDRMSKEELIKKVMEYERERGARSATSPSVSTPMQGVYHSGSSIPDNASDGSVSPGSVCEDEEEEEDDIPLTPMDTGDDRKLGHVKSEVTSASSSAKNSPTLSSQDNPDDDKEDDEKHQCLWKGCNKEFLNMEGLISHVGETHIGSGKATYCCEWEGCARNQKPFTKRHKMYNHLRTHTGERPFMCMITGCGKRFSRPDSLTTHVKTHSNVRPYVCPVKGCGKAYYHSRSLRKHEKTHDVRHQGHGLPPFAGHPYMHAHVDYRQPHGMYNPRPPHGYAPSHHYHPHPHYPPPSYPFPGPGLSAHHLKNEPPVSSPGAAAVAAAQAAASNRNYSVPPLMPSDMYHRSPMEIYPNPGQNNGSSSNPPSGSSSPNAGSPSLPSSARIPSRLPPLSQMQGHQNPASGLYPPPLSLKFPNSSPGPLSFGSNHGGPHPYPTPGASPPYAHPPTLPSPAVGGPMPFPTPNGASQSPMQFQFFR